MKYRINKQAVETNMYKNKYNYTDLAEKMETTRARLHYMVNKGGKRYAEPLAKALGCKPNELIIGVSFYRT